MNKNVKKNALIYCESQFGLVDGKTANGLVRHSERYDILGVIDSSLAGRDAGLVLGGGNNDIPIFADLEEALEKLPEVPTYFIYGKAPIEPCLSQDERSLILSAMEKGMDIVNGLHQLFSEDTEFIAKAAKCDVQIFDWRKTPSLKELHLFTNQIAMVDVPVIAVLGTDCACGKMTTAIELNKAFNALGIESVLVATGQTGLMQGAIYGLSIDALTSQYVVGEIEHAVVNAYIKESPDIILVEGQGSVSHPAFMSSIAILKGSKPDGVIVQHAPARKWRCDFSHLPMPTINSEISLIEAISESKVVGITLSHEDLSYNETEAIIDSYESLYHLPTADVLSNGCEKIIQSLVDRFPSLDNKLKQEASEEISVLETPLS